MSNKSAKGHAKNARNKLDAMRTAKHKEEKIDKAGIEYCLEEVKAAIEAIDND